MLSGFPNLQELSVWLYMYTVGRYSFIALRLSVCYLNYYSF